MFMRFLGIGIGHCSQHPTDADIGASDGNGSDSEACTMDNGDEGDGELAIQLKKAMYRMMKTRVLT